MADVLKQAIGLLRGGKRKQAMKLLAGYVRRNRKDPQGWFLLAAALDDRAQRISALEQALALSPEHKQARQMLEKLGAAASPPPPPPPVEQPPAASPDPPTSQPAFTTETLPTDEVEAAPPEPELGLDEEELPSWMKPAIPGEKPQPSPAPQPPAPQPAEEEGTPFSWEQDIEGLPEDPAPQAAFQEAEPTAEDSVLDIPAVDASPAPEEEAPQQTVPETEEQSGLPSYTPPPVDETQIPKKERKEKEKKKQAEPARQPTEQKSRSGCWTWGIIAVVVVCVGLATAGWAVFNYGLVPLAQVEPTYTSVVDALPPTEITPNALPPTWTPSPSPPASTTPLPTDPATLTPTPTVFLLPAVKAEMEDIQQEVASLRGWEVEQEVYNELMPLFKLRSLVEELLLDNNYLDGLPDQEIVLSAFGFLDPNYDLIKAAVDHAADALGGFYVPESNNLYVIGSVFSGIERYVYSHEYMHALQDQQYDLANLGVYPICTRPQQECQAIRALVEGEASVMMDLWWASYASDGDSRIIGNYVPPETLFSDEGPPPPYFSADGLFAYEFGYLFVEYLITQADYEWVLVDLAYTTRLPTTTEQILHPEKYMGGEAGIPVSDPALDAILPAENWRLVEQDSLGEWQTILLLGYSNYPEARLSDFEAFTGGAGWGGDSYQIYHNDANGETVMSVHWVWDTPEDNAEFSDALIRSLGGRYRGAVIIGPGSGTCWTNNGEFACVYSNGNETLWLLTPSLELMETVKGLFPAFP